MTGIFTVFSTQNAEQRLLANRFERLALSSQLEPAAIKVHAHELQLLPDIGSADSFRSENWYSALVQKTAYWSHVARTHQGQLVLCSDNDVTLLPGWLDALLDACSPDLDLCFQREGGNDPFFDNFPYNSGFFLMRGSHLAANFWREVSQRTAIDRPFVGDQSIVNAMLHTRSPHGSQCASTGLRHGHFEPHAVVVGGPQSNPSLHVLSMARAHHATASGSPSEKLHALEAFRDQWLAHAARTNSSAKVE